MLSVANVCFGIVIEMWKYLRFHTQLPSPKFTTHSNPNLGWRHETRWRWTETPCLLNMFSFTDT